MKTVDVCNLTGATYRQLDHWTTKGYVGPSIAVTRGTGYCREWSTEDAVQVAVMVELVAVGMDPGAAANYVSPYKGFPGNLTRASRERGAIRIDVAVDRIREQLTDRRDSRRMSIGWDQAACAGKDPAEWDAETEYAYRHCQACPLMARCLQQALLPEDDGGAPHGMRGGWTSEQRKYFKRHGKQPRRVNWAAFDKKPEAKKPAGMAGNRLLPEEHEFRMKLYNDGLTDKEIAPACCVTRHAIQSWRKANKLPPNKAKVPDHDLRVDCWRRGLTAAQAARELGTTANAMGRWRSKWGYGSSRMQAAS